MISVDRKTSQNAALFAASFTAFDHGDLIVIFPEGTSYTLPALQSFKDGASWLALEYALSSGHTIPIIPVTSSYQSKGTFRSYVSIEYGRPIPYDDIVKEFADDGASTNLRKDLVKKLTRRTAQAMSDLSITAPDWYVDHRSNEMKLSICRNVYHASITARDLLFPREVLGRTHLRLSTQK